MNILVAMESPIRLVEMLPAETKSTLLLPQASAISCCRLLPGSCQSGLRTKSAVGAVVALITARVLGALILARASGLAATTRSQPITRLASPVAVGGAGRASGPLGVRTRHIP